MSLLTARPRRVLTPDKFLMSRSFVLWSDLATATNGALVQQPGSGLFGGWRRDPAHSLGTYLEWDNVPLSPGTWKIKIICQRDPGGGVLHLDHNGVDTGARLDMGGATQNDFLIEDTFTVGTKTLGPIRLTCASTNTGTYEWYYYVAWLEKVTPTANNGTGHGDLDWFVDILPYNVHNTDLASVPYTAWPSGSLWGGWIDEGGAGSPYFIEWKVPLGKGTWDLYLSTRAATKANLDWSLDGGPSIGSRNFGTSPVSVTPEIVKVASAFPVGQSGMHILRMDATTTVADLSIELEHLHARRISL